MDYKEISIKFQKIEKNKIVSVFPHNIACNPFLKLKQNEDLMHWSKNIKKKLH